MKVLSLNVRGFAVKGKFGWVRNICARENPWVAAFLETKCAKVDDRWVNALWGGDNFGYVQKEVIGKSGGLLVIWDSSVFDIIDCVGGINFLAIRGKWVSSGMESIIVNVYGPHSDRDKKVFWESLENLVGSINTSWLLVGDFNEVRSSDDRLNSQFHQYRADRFNEFITINALIDIDINGRKYTGISDDGLKFSKIDRFLVNNSFLRLWEDLSVNALDRHLSDHCPLVLRDKLIDYGPKPFKVFDEWLNCEGIDKIILDAWGQPIRGSRKDYIFRDKLKNVKFALKEWSIKEFGGLDLEIYALKREAMEWELNDESNVITDSDRERWLECRRRWVEK
ncbi:uncharacterized protein [Rutidosis leptorrhynchoides]|uniref:uncharacterized protein n=1 Tax=Rutidosis leptorrhynchoides TaxID=125765 RepID=UPI003A99DDF5